MGRVRTPKYVVEITPASRRYGITPEEWRVRRDGVIPGYGKPNAANLAKFIEAHNRSVMPGGCNEHLGSEMRAVYAVIRPNHRGAEPIAEWLAPTFSVWG